ncbi:MAG TPA: hypothetical protein PLY93_07865 [Turneriella sp.]|nr:hypothetical protein [Turneriella sp.]
MKLNSILAAVICLITLSCRDKDLGVKTAQKYCTNCHALPLPADLDKESWGLVLDSMGTFIGIPSQNKSRPLFRAAANTVIPKRTITDSEWQALSDYFISGAHQDEQPPKENAKMCNVSFQKTEIRIDSPVQAITWVELDAACNCLRFAEGIQGDLFEADLKGKIRKKIHVGYSVTGSVEIHGKKYFVAAKNLLPNDDPSGILFTLNGQTPKILRNDLIRPVYITSFTDNNKVPFLIISEFGHTQGRLSKINLTNYERTTLSDLSGYISSLINGKGELLALRAQADEAIVQFAPNIKNLIRFSPSWGSTSIAWTTFDAQNKEYLVTSHGDNGDLPDMPYKPAHGIRVYENIDNNWAQKYFYPMPGAYKVMTGKFFEKQKTD